MILGIKESGVKRITKTQRVTLPRLFDAVLRMLGLLALCTTTDKDAISAFVLDFHDAFWQIPLHPDEQRFYCATAPLNGKRKYQAFLRAPQGSSTAPTLWTRVAALIMRLTQAIYDPAEVNLMCYVNDPLAALRGSEQLRQKNAAIMVLVWEALGFRLAYSKGQLGSIVAWIGSTFTCESKGVRAWVKESIITDLCDDLRRISKRNVVSKKELHSMLGKLVHAAGLLLIMRPFLEPLWAALYCKDQGDTSGCPHNCIWAKQIASSLQWLPAFFLGKTNIERFFSLDAYLRTGAIVEMGTGASPWGWADGLP